MWDIACIRDREDEDNDTDEEGGSSDEEDGQSQQAKLLNMMSSLLHSRKANINDLKKGFVFFMEQEKKELKRVRNKMKEQQ